MSRKNNKTPEMKPKQDSFRPWLKLIPAAAVFAAVCVTCYQADKSPVETTSVSDNNVMSTDEIKELISQGTAGKDFDSEDSSETNGTSISKTSKRQKTSKIKTGTKKIHLQVPLQMEVQQGWCRKHSHTNYRSSCRWICRRYLYRLRNRFGRNDHCSGNCQLTIKLQLSIL